MVHQHPYQPHPKVLFNPASSRFEAAEMVQHPQHLSQSRGSMAQHPAPRSGGFGGPHGQHDGMGMGMGYMQQPQQQYQAQQQYGAQQQQQYPAQQQAHRPSNSFEALHQQIYPQQYPGHPGHPGQGQLQNGGQFPGHGHFTQQGRNMQQGQGQGHFPLYGQLPQQVHFQQQQPGQYQQQQHGPYQPNGPYQRTGQFHGPPHHQSMVHHHHPYHRPPHFQSIQTHCQKQYQGPPPHYQGQPQHQGAAPYQQFTPQPVPQTIASNHFPTRNDYNSQLVNGQPVYMLNGPSLRSRAPPPVVPNYNNMTYDKGPIEDFSSRPSIPMEAVKQRLGENMTRHSYINDAAKFRPMNRILKQNGQAPGFPEQPRAPWGKAAGPKVSEAVNCCVYIEGLHPETTYADLFEVLIGKIYKTHITPPNGRYNTAAAKVGFFWREDALNFFNQVRSGQLYIKKCQVPICKWNWDGYDQAGLKHNPAFHSRVLIIKGPYKMMSLDLFEEKFKNLIHYDLEAKFETPCSDSDKVKYEFRFGSVPSQSEAAIMIMQREPEWQGIYEASFGPDPCEELKMQAYDPTMTIKEAKAEEKAGEMNDVEGSGAGAELKGTGESAEMAGL